MNPGDPVVELVPAATGRARLGMELFARLRRARSLFGRKRTVLAEAAGGFASNVTVQGVTEKIRAEKAFLLELVRGIEAEFIATGEGLARLSGHVGEIQRPCEELADVTVSEGHDSALQFAFQLLKKAEDLVLASYEQYDHVFATFRLLEERLSEIARRRDELMRVLLPLRFITMSFRIEAARHPEQVREAFFTLGENVDRTIEEVRGTMERQFADIASSARIAKTVIEQIADSVRAHRAEVAATLSTSREQLRALTAALSVSGEGASGLAELNRSARRHIGGIVMAQQCQDIARQQVEHVGAALDEICAHLEQTGRGGVEEDEARHFVSRAGRLQLQHVADVFERLDGAAREIKAGMESLRGEATAAAEAALRVGRSALDETVAEQCQAGIGELLGILRQAVQKIADILGAFAPLQASFVDCTGRATLLAGDVGYAGLNAQIFAVHAPSGATLEVLAGRVRGVSEEVVEHVAKMGAALNQTTQLVENLKQRLEDFQVLARSEESVLAQESDETRERLARLKERIPELIAKVSTRQKTFGEEVEQILSGVRFPESVRTASVRSLGFFRELVAWGDAVDAAHAAREGAAKRIESLRANYTMESERAVHDAALGGGTVLAAAETAPGEAGFDLFDEPATARPNREEGGEDAGGVVQVASAPSQTTAVSGENVPIDKAKPGTAAGSDDNIELF